MILLKYPAWIPRWWWHVSLWASYAALPHAVGERKPGDSLRFCPMFTAAATVPSPQGLAHRVEPDFSQERLKGLILN